MVLAHELAKLLPTTTTLRSPSTPQLAHKTFEYSCLLRKHKHVPGGGESWMGIKKGGRNKGVRTRRGYGAGRGQGGGLTYNEA